MTLPTHGRYDYLPITQRAVYDWPNGTRLAVYVGLNLEHFAFGEGLGAELAPEGPQPDVLNFAWRDYGNRVGAWRMLVDIPGRESVSVPSRSKNKCFWLMRALLACARRLRCENA